MSKFSCEVRAVIEDCVVINGVLQLEESAFKRWCTRFSGFDSVSRTAIGRELFKLALRLFTKVPHGSAPLLMQLAALTGAALGTDPRDRLTPQIGQDFARLLGTANANPMLTSVSKSARSSWLAVQSSVVVQTSVSKSNVPKSK